MSGVDVFLDGLGDEARVAMRALVAQAYDRGFREGMSAAGTKPEDVVATTLAAALATSPPPVAGEVIGAPVVPTAPREEPDPAGVNWSEGEGDAAEDEAAAADAPRPIMVHATIGTLMRRIERTFALERFDIDVVVCRRGDREKRQLKANVRLKNYVLER